MFFALLFMGIGLATAQTQVHGTVVDEFGDPVIGATIQIRGTSQGTATDLDGAFTISAPADGILIVSYVGYITQEVSVRPNTHVILVPDSEVLDELVVVGYGTMRRRDLTGAVSMVNAQAMEREMPSTVQDMLRTGVPGLSVATSTTARGETDDLMLRGQNSFAASNAPLLVLDGVIYFGQLTDINPLDIERIDILKDASSTAVFGARAANGVIMITTKRGTTARPTIRFNSNIGWAFTNALPPTYKGEEYVHYRQAVMRAQNPARPSFYYDDPATLNNTDLSQWLDGIPAGDMSTLRRAWMTRLRFDDIELYNYFAGNVIDWEKLTYQTALNQDYTVSVSGKAGETSYFTSLNYVNNEGNQIGDRFSAVRARVNLDSRVTNWLSFGMNTQFTVNNQGGLATSGDAYRTVSPYGDVYDENGKLTQFATGNLNHINPLTNPYFTDRAEEVSILNASTFLRLSLPYGFSLQSTYSPRFRWRSMRRHQSTEHPAWNTSGHEVARRENNYDFLWQLDNVLSWNKEFDKHFIDFTGLFNLEEQTTRSDRMIGRAFEPSDVLGASGMGWATVSEITSDDTYRTALALMARAHYTFDNRYLLTTTIRRDGYSAFGVNNPYATFPSVAVGWVFSEENFMPETDWLNFGRLRLSWGKTGNREIGIYDALMRMAAQKYFIIDERTGELVTVNTYYASRMGNNNLRWETTTAYNLGLDFGLFKNRLTGSVEVYSSKTNDLLISRQLPNITGYVNVLSNIGEVQNTGIEVTLSSRNIRTRNFNWNTDFGLAHNKNRINSLYGLMENVYDTAGNIIGQREADDITNQRFIGRSIYEIWDYRILGVWQEGEEMDEAAINAGLRPGDFKILDKNGDGRYNNDDREFIGSRAPLVTMNMRNSFTFYNDFTFSFNLISQLGQWRSYDRAKNNNALINTTNQIKNNFWTPDNPTNNYARLGSITPVGYTIWRKSSFVRLENIALSYQVPRAFISKANLGVEAVNLNFSARNLYYWTIWPGQDPEARTLTGRDRTAGDPNTEVTGIGNDRNVPITVSFGLNVTF